MKLTRDQIKISASLLSADMANFERDINLVADAVDYVHCDVMDGHFVPNLTFGVPVVKAIRRVSPVPLDVHLMIKSPGIWVERYISTGLKSEDFLTFHIEDEPDPEMVIETIRSGNVRPGIAVKPGTSFESFSHLVPLVDQVLVMTVEPGFGGQSFMRGMMSKIQSVRDLAEHETVIGVDGGIDPTTAPEAVLAGANLLAAGSAIFGQEDPVSAARELREAAAKALL